MTTRFTDDFSSGAWATNWTSTITGTSNIQDVVSGEGRIQVPNGSARAVTAFDKATASANQEILVKVRDDAASRNNQLLIGVAMVPTAGRFGSSSSGAYITVSGASNGAVVLYHGRSSTWSAGVQVDTFANTAATRWYRLRHRNGTLYYKSWIDGQAEPGTWTYTLDITGFTALPAGSTGLAVETLSATTALENYYFDGIESTDAPAAITVVNGGYTAQAMTASALSVDAIAKGNVVRASITDDTYVSSSASNSTAAGADTTISINGINSGIWGYINFPAPTLNAGEAVSGAKLYLTRAGSNSADSFNIYKVNAAWSESTLTYDNRPTDTLVKTVSVPAGVAGEVIVIDLAGVDLTNGIRLSRVTFSSTLPIHSSEATSSGNRPYVDYTIGAVANASVSTTPMTATALMVDPVTSTSRTVSASGQPMTASVALPNATATAQTLIGVSMAAEPMWAQAEMGDNGFAIPAQVTAAPAEATATLVTPSAGTTKAVEITSEAMTARIFWVQPEAVNDNAIVLDESEDAYFQRVNALAPESWWRLNDKTSTVVDRVGGDANGTYLSVLFGQHDGPEGRASTYFDGDGYIQGGPLELSQVPGTLEFSFRTTRANSFLMLSADDRSAPTATVDEPNREIYLSNGRITFKTYYFQTSTGGQPDPTTFSGSRNLADGEWHHVVIRPFNGYNGAGTEIWVDGQFEVRRYGAGSWNGMPDYVGGRPGIPTSQFLLGDMSEIAFYEKSISNDDITLNYYAFMGWAPIHVEPMEAFAFTPAGTSGKGNQKRALYLYWDKRSEWEKGGSAAEATTFDPMPEFVSTTSPAEPVGDYHGFKVFAKGIRVKADGTAYRDQFTDEQSLIDLSVDVDLNLYDVIMFKDWPDEGPELDDIDSTYPGARERLTRQIREANSKGIGLYVTNPRLAIDLGIIDRVEFVPTLMDTKAASGQGAARGLYDYGSAVKFPWNIAASDGLMGGQYAVGIGQPEITDPNYLANKAYFYHDTNKNDRFRVRALIDNLTDIPSYMIADAVFHVDYDPWGWQGAAFKYLKREDGLRIGDEYMFNGAEIISSRYEDAVERRYNRYSGTWATPAGHVLAGTIVTTFGAKHWNGTQEVDNPYKDYATTIVLEPGDSLAGKPVGGKIFVNFSEQPSRGLGVAVQVLPEPGNNVVWPYQYPVETAAQREWDYSWTRTTLRTTGNSNVSVVTIVLPSGETASVPLSASTTDLSMVRSNQLFPVEAKPRWEMDGRGMFWLSVKDEVNPGDVTVKATALTATAQVVEPAVVAQRSTRVSANAMVALAVATKVREDVSGAADVYTLPMTAAATITGYGKTINAEPMVAHAELVENFDSVHATGEQVVLYLHGVDVTLFIKEEA